MEKDRIYGIHCNVDNCVYNSNNCECTAGKINVGCTCTDPAVTKQSARHSRQEANSPRHGQWTYAVR